MECKKAKKIAVKISDTVITIKDMTEQQIEAWLHLTQCEDKECQLLFKELRKM